jgi:putative chitinase
MNLTPAIQAAAPGLAFMSAANWADILARPMQSAGITTPHRAAAFIGMCAVESDGFTTMAENLNYTHADRIAAVWPSRFGPGLADPAAYVGQPEKLANLVYANRMGNGPPESGDGWRFRGLGLIQITGREEHTAFRRAAGMSSVVDAAAFAATPPGAAASAAWFWGWKTRLGATANSLADSWSTTDLTALINGGYEGLIDRVRACNAALAVLS